MAQSQQKFFAGLEPSYEHMPFLGNQNFPSNRPLVYVNRASRTPVNVLMSSYKPASPKKSNPYKTKRLDVGSDHKVCVSYAEEGPESFCVQLVTDAKNLQDMMDAINKRPHSSLAEPPMIGTVCLGKMSGDRICRAIIQNVSGSQCQLNFVDFGFTEMVSYYDIFNMPEEFMLPKVFAMRYCLSGVKEWGKGPQNEAFKQLVKGQVLTLRVVAPEGPPLIQYGELILDNKNMSDLLLANIQDKLQFKWLEMLPPGRHHVEVSCVDSCIKFFVQLLDNMDEFYRMMKAVKEHCENSTSPGELPVGAACCARFPVDGRFYRGHVKSTHGNKIIVAFVDFGNEEEVSVSDLRPITPKLIRLPAKAMKCALKGYENKEVNADNSNQLKMLVLGRVLVAHVIGMLSIDTMLVNLIYYDSSISPPVDVATKMTQLSTPRSNNRESAMTPVRKDAPEGVINSFKDDPERRPRDQGGEKFGERCSSFQGRDNKLNQIKNEERGNKNRPDRHDNRGDRRDNWGDKMENFKKREHRDINRERGDGTRSKFTPRDRADRSYNSDNNKRSEMSFRSQDSESCSKFTQVQYKELPDPIPLETPFEEPTVKTGAQHNVSVTWIISPESFYAQILTEQPKFLKLMHLIPILYKGVKSYTGLIPVGASVLARYPADGVLYRATVVSAHPSSKFVVRYVDFGNKQLVDAKDIWQLDRQLMELPKMAVHCSLLGVAPKEGEWKANPEIDLCFNAPRYQCVFQECVDGHWQVYLSVSVGEILVEKKLAVPSEHQSSVVLKDEAIDLKILVGQQILCKVTHVKSYAEFYVQLDLEKAALVENAIANFDDNKLTPLTQETLADGVHCTVRHEGKVYRAILESTQDPHKIQALLPDYGFSITTSLANLMILPVEMSVYFYQSLKCGLNNYNSSSKPLMTEAEMMEKLTGNKFIISIDHVDDITLMSTLYETGSGKKVAIFEPDPFARERVEPLCARSVFRREFGTARVAHADSLRQLYLQKASDSDRVAPLLNQLYNFYEEGTPEALGSFEADTPCAAKSSDGNWYRATVLSATDDDATVQFADYGNSETIPKDNVKKLDPKFVEPCSLALVASLGVNALQDDALSKLLEWTTDKEVQVTLEFGSDGWVASLHLDGVDLCLKLLNEKLATPKVSAEEENTEVPDEEPISPPPGCTQVYISHIDTPGHFWLQMVDKEDKIDEIQMELQVIAALYTDVKNRDLGTFCVAKYLADDQWYRAEILDADADFTTVRYTDYGNTDVLDNQPGLIKVLPYHLREIERYAFKSSVNAVPTGSGEWSEAASEYFNTLVGDIATSVDALIVLKDDTTYVDIFVKGHSITDKLVSKGYATKSQEPECGGDLPSCFASHIHGVTAAPELQAMEVGAENLPALGKKEEGVLCAAKYPEDGECYGAQVIVGGSEGTEVLFMEGDSTFDKMASLKLDERKDESLDEKTLGVTDTLVNSQEEKEITEENIQIAETEEEKSPDEKEITKVTKTDENSQETIQNTEEMTKIEEMNEKKLTEEQENTLENINETIKTPERDDSKDSLHTDMGYTSENDKLSPMKEEISTSSSSLSPKRID